MPSSLWVGPIQSVEGLKRTERLTLMNKGNIFCLMALTWDIGLFPVFGLKLKHWLFLGLEPAGIETETFTISSPGAPEKGDIYICI